MPVRFAMRACDERGRSPGSIRDVSQRHERSNALALLHPQRITVKRLLGCTWQTHHRGKLEYYSFSAKERLDSLFIGLVLQQEPCCFLHSTCHVQNDVVAAC